MANITYIRIDDEVYALHDDNALTSDSNLDASKVVGTLPANTYTNTTYENKAAVESGTDVSLVTTGDKYRWNNASGGGVSDVEVNGSSVVSGGVAEITVPTKTSDLTNDSNFQNATQVDAAINSRIASVYKAKGSVAFLDLPALTSSNEGFVYDVNESFTTTSDFVEGAGKTYPAGTNVVIIDIGSGVYKYDVLAGLVDLSGKQDLLVSGTNIKTINSQSILGSGNISISSELQNLVDGNSVGSVRGIGTSSETSSYNLGEYALAEGYFTFANGDYSHAEGENTKANGEASHAEGINTYATGTASHSMGVSTIASGNHQVALGVCNVSDEENLYAVIVGNGESVSNRSNALTVDWDGNVDISSGASYKINGTALSASDVGAQPTLISGTNIKTINGNSVLGSGDLTIGSGGLQNLVDGDSTGSIRGIDTLPTTVDYSTSLGYATHANNYYQLVTGSWNTNELSSNNLFVIGNGTSASQRSNALTVDESGNVDIASGASYKINGTALSASDVGAISDVEVDGISVVRSGIAEIDLTGKQDTLTAGTLINIANDTVSIDGSALLDLVYPVGSYVWFSTNFNPNTSWGGTWEPMNEGITLVSAGQTYTIQPGTAKDGGRTDAILPTHYHSVSEQSTGNMSANSTHNHDVTYGVYKRTAATAETYAATFDLTNKTKNTSTESVQHTHKVPSHNTNSTGISNADVIANANMPPYKAAYCWHRTA